MRQAVTASTQEAADAGLAILRSGGNAVDGAVAAALAACVADPCNSGIGGYGGYLVTRFADGRAGCVSFGLWTPAALGQCMEGTAFGPGSSAVPNVVAGLQRALVEYGTQPWAEVSRPAIRLALEGVTANGVTERAFAEVRGAPFLDDCFVFARVEAAGRECLRFRQPRLAGTLERLAAEGPAWFYEGPLGSIACRAWRTAGVDIPLEAWRSAPEAVRTGPPARFSVGGLAVLSAPLGISGSASLFAAIAAASEVSARSRLDEPEALAELAQRMAGAWTHRFATPEGNRFDGADLRRWVSQAIAAAPGRQLQRDHGHTTHVNVLDGAGNMAAMTLTLGQAWFGGRWALQNSGVLMNCGLRNFSRSGSISDGGRRRGVSNMAPSIAALPSGDRIAIGCPGARRIPTNIALVLARVAFNDQSLRDAVSHGRLHAEDYRRVTFEASRLDRNVERALRECFAEVAVEDWRHYFGPLTAIRLGAAGEVEVAVDDREVVGFTAVC